MLLRWIYTLAFPWQKGKTKVVPIAPDKLVGKGTGAEEVFRPKTTYEAVPGVVGQVLEKHMFFTCVPRQGDQVVHSVTRKVQVVREPEREAFLRKDYNIFEILRAAFAGEDFPADEKIKLLTKRYKMKSDAVFKFERVRTVARLALGCYTWDRRLLRFGVEVSPRATIAEIVAKAQLKAEEMLEDASHYDMFSNGHRASPPWTQAKY
jgi:hypothetical protein